MKVLSIDIETFSSVNLKKCGVYKYAESEDFEILLFGYAVDGGAVQVVDLARGESIPAEIIWNFYMKISPIPCRSLSVLPLCHRRTENLS